MNTAWPWLTVGIAMVALLALEHAGLMQALQYERAAVEAGEYWRLLSSHLVHFSPEHLTANLCAFAALAALVERCHGRRFLALLLAWLALVAGMVLPLMTGMQFYGGLSAVCYGLLTWMCLTQSGPGRFVLVAVVAHTLWQWAIGSSAFAFAVPAGTVVAWQVHLTCMLGAFALFAMFRFRQQVSCAAMP